MHRSFLPRLASSLGLSILIACSMTSCSTKYQDLLNDRDTQIRELNMRLSEARSGLTDAERSAQEAKDALARERSKPPVEAANKTSELDALKNELPGTDISYRRGRLSIGIDNSVTFDSGSEKLKASGEKVLHKVAEVLKRRFSGQRVYVEGHTDGDPINKTKGKYDDNVDLSLERAKAVRTFLVKGCSVPERAVVVVGYGEHDPRDRGTSEASKSKNRRVEIVVGESF